MWELQERSSEIVTPRYLADWTVSRIMGIVEDVSGLDGPYSFCDM